MRKSILSSPSLPSRLAASICLLGLFTISPATAQDAGPQEPKVLVELVDVGKAPLQKLRFVPKKGATVKAVMTLKMSQSMELGGQVQPATAIPAQKITMEVTVNDVSSDGDISYAFKYTDLDVVEDPANPSPIGNAIRETLKPMIGATGSGVVTSRGIAKKGEMQIPEGLQPQLKAMLEGLKDSLNSLSAPVPEEAVGAGARWRTTQNVSANGMKIKQIAMNEVTKLDSNSCTLKITLTQEAQPQAVKNPALPPGVTMTLDSLDTTGDGVNLLVFDSVFPQESTVNVNSKVKMTVAGAGQTQQVGTQMKMEMSLKAEK